MSGFVQRRREKDWRWWRGWRDGSRDEEELQRSRGELRTKPERSRLRREEEEERREERRAKDGHQFQDSEQKFTGQEAIRGMAYRLSLLSRLYSR